MAAGLGFKDFTTGEVLTAADVDGYLMQGVLVFASSAARDAAITSPQEGQFAFLKDTNTTMYYTGAAWTNLDTTGLTNPMTTTGDIIYSSPGSTPVRLGIGSTGNVLTVASGVPSWAAPAGGGKVLQVVQGTTDTAVSSSSGTMADTGLTATITPSSATSKILVYAVQNGCGKSNGNAANYLGIELRRDSTTIQKFVDGLHYMNSAQLMTGATAVGICLDTPNTTSAITYKTRFASNAGTSSVIVQENTAMSSITLMEIGA